MLALAQDLADGFAWLVDETHLEEGHACCGFRVLKLDGQAGDAEFVELGREAGAQAIGDEGLLNTVRFAS
jgi:hypothetical protein